MRSWLAASLVLTALGCASAPSPCVSSITCGPGRACTPSGACGAIAAEPDARSSWLAPRRWEVAGGPEGLDRDRAVLGGDIAFRLVFDVPSPPPSRAWLVLGAVEPASVRGQASIVVARRESDGAELARVHVAAGAARPIVLDLGVAAGGALAVSITASDPLDVATPRHLDRHARPRLELTWRATPPLDQ